MIESSVSGAQLAVVAVCYVLSARRLMRVHSLGRELTALFYGSFLLGGLYWQLYLLFYQHTPSVFSVSDLSWYASFLFLYLLLRVTASPEEQRVRNWRVWTPPVFCAVMGVFYYVQCGDLLGNLISAVLMGLLASQTARGLLAVRGGGRDGRRALYLTALIFCVTEYAMWTASCFWQGDTPANPYFWFDSLQTVNIACIFAAAGKAVEG